MVDTCNQTEHAEGAKGGVKRMGRKCWLFIKCLLLTPSSPIVFVFPKHLGYVGGRSFPSPVVPFLFAGLHNSTLIFFLEFNITIIYFRSSKVHHDTLLRVFPCWEKFYLLVPSILFYFVLYKDKIRNDHIWESTSDSNKGKHERMIVCSYVCIPTNPSICRFDIMMIETVRGNVTDLELGQGWLWRLASYLKSK